MRSARDMGRANQFRCDAIILALDRRLQAFYHGGKLLSYLAEPPYVTLLSTISSFVGGVVLLASDKKLPIPTRYRKRVRHVRLRKFTRKGIAGVLGELRRARLKASRILILDAGAPFIEADTLIALLKGLKTSDVAGVVGSGSAIAIKSDALSALVASEQTGSPADLWECFCMPHQDRPGRLKTSKVEALRWYERPITNSFQAYKAAKDRHLNALLSLTAKGLLLKDPGRLDLRGNLSVGRGVYIDTDVIIIGEVWLGEGVTIGSNCILEDAEIKAKSVIKEFTTVSGSTIEMNCRIGPYARIRHNSFIGKHCQIGNFVEVKNTKMAANCKINHHGFIGDAKIGRNVIIGAGSITCNFDGAKTNLTVIGDNAFVGSGVMLVAPLSVGRNAFVGAGSTVVKEVPANSLTLSRAKQVSIKGWERRRYRKRT